MYVSQSVQILSYYIDKKIVKIYLDLLYAFQHGTYVSGGKQN